MTTTGETVGDLLLVEDERKAGDAIARVLALHGSVRRAERVRDAMTELRTAGRNWIAAVIDVGLPDGSGMDLATRLLEPPHAMPCLVITGDDDRYLANEAHAAGAEFVFKPVKVNDIERFVVRAVAKRPVTRIAAALDAYAAEVGYSAREKDIVRLALAGVERRDISGRLDTQDSTVKTQVRSILGKSPGASDLGGVVRIILERALKT